MTALTMEWPNGESVTITEADQSSAWTSSLAHWALVAAGGIDDPPHQRISFSGDDVPMHGVSYDAIRFQPGAMGELALEIISRRQRRG